MKKINIQIPDMQSTHCQTRVGNALKNITALGAYDVQPGQADVQLQNPGAQQEVLDTIQKLGYTVGTVKDITDSGNGTPLVFKTNINCSGCIATVTPALDEVAGTGHWQVNTADRDKILTVDAPVSEQEIVKAVQNKGFRIEKY